MFWRGKNNVDSGNSAKLRVFESYSDMCPDRTRRLEQLAYKYGQYSESYLITEPNRSYIWSSCDQGVIGCVREGKHILVVGGLITHDSNKAKFVNEIADYSKANGVRFLFYHIDDRDVALFEAAGFQVSKLVLKQEFHLKAIPGTGSRTSGLDDR